MSAARAIHCQTLRTSSLVIHGAESVPDVEAFRKSDSAGESIFTEIQRLVTASERIS